MRVDIERVLAIKEELKAINSAELSEIEFYKDGVPFVVRAKEIEAWSFLGLNNTDFITSKYAGYPQVMQFMTSIANGSDNE